MSTTAAVIPTETALDRQPTIAEATRPASDPLLLAIGSGASIWQNGSADRYVEELRGGWPASR